MRSRSNTLTTVARFPAGVRLGLGCVDHTDRHVETPGEIAARVEAALAHVASERITLHPDCGIAPSVQNPMDLDEAYRKLRALAEAARSLRARFPG